MVEVEERSLRTLEQDSLTRAERAIDQERRVRDVRSKPSGVAELLLHDRLDLERLEPVDALEPHVLLLHRELELLAQDLRIEKVLDADSDARRLVRIGGTDPAPRRTDLEPTQATLAGSVERDVPRHDEVCVPG